MFATFLGLGARGHQRSEAVVVQLSGDSWAWSRTSSVHDEIPSLVKIWCVVFAEVTSNLETGIELGD